MVLEPLPGRVVRHAEPRLSLFLRQGTASGKRLGEHLSQPAGNPAIPEPCRRQIRPAPELPVRDQGHRRPLRRRHLPVDGHDRQGRQGHGQVCRVRARGSFGHQHPRLQGHRQLQGEDRPHRTMAGRARPARQAGRGGRHRIDRAAGDHRQRSDRRTSDGVPTDAPVQRSGREPSAIGRIDRRDQEELRRDLGAGLQLGRRLRFRGVDDTGDVGNPGRARPHLPGGMGRRRRFPLHVRHVQRHRHGRSRQQGRQGLHNQENQGDREGSQDRRTADADGSLCQAAAVRTPLFRGL